MRLYLTAFFIMALLLTPSAYPEETISLDYLLKSKWGPEHNGYGYYYTFQKNGTLVGHCEAEGGMPPSGTFVIKNNGLDIRLTWFDKTSDRRFKRFTTSDSLFCEEFLGEVNSQNTLFKDSIIMWNITAKVRAGSKRKINGIDVIIMDKKPASVQDRVYFRNYPSTEKGKRLVFTLETSGSGKIASTPFLPLGHPLTVICRTDTKHKIGKHENYWYYVNVNIDWYQSAALEDGSRLDANACAWVYGAFISLSK